MSQTRRPRTIRIKTQTAVSIAVSILLPSKKQADYRFSAPFRQRAITFTVAGQINLDTAAIRLYSVPAQAAGASKGCYVATARETFCQESL
jgi:hypothetical protein